jgi:hypothetical protein
MEERTFNASAVVAYLESHYNLKFEKEEPRASNFGLFDSYKTIYNNHLEITIDDGEFVNGGKYVGFNTWDKTDLSGVGIPCEDMELILKYIDRFGIEKKSGYEQLTLF